MRVTIRALHPMQLEPLEEVVVERRRVTLFERGEAVRVHLRVYSVRVGLVVEADESPTLLEPGERLVLEKRVRRLCRYHEGPRGDPLAQRWCHATAVNGSWCARHRSSPLAVYERCVAGHDEDACRAVDALWPDEEYIVYLVYHGAGFKVGVTRAWRLYTRLLEQPHIAAAIVARLGSALEARRMERRLASLGPGEGIGVPLRRRMAESLTWRLGARDAAEKIAEGLARLGLQGDFEALALRVECPVASLLSPRSEPPTGELVYRCAWGGVIVFEASGTPVGVKRDAVIHWEHIGRL